MKSNEWGKSKTGTNFFPFLAKNKKKPGIKDVQSSLTTLYKFPRERYQGQSILLTKQLEDSHNLVDQDNPMKFRGTFYSTKSKFSDKLRN